MNNNLLKVAVAQMLSSQGDILKNRETIKNYIIQASAQSADILVTPELSNVGYNLTILKKLNYSFREELEYYCGLAQKYEITLALGLLEKESFTLFNSLVVIGSDGKLISKYRKINLFPLNEENEVFERGAQPAYFTIGNFKIGLAICYDIRFPELFRVYLENDCNAIIVSSAFPFPRLEHWQILLKAHAIMNQCYLIASNRIGIDNNLQFLGNSSIIDPWGIVLTTFDDKAQGLLVETLDLSKVDEVRNKIPSVFERKKY